MDLNILENFKIRKLETFSVCLSVRPSVVANEKLWRSATHTRISGFCLFSQFQYMKLVQWQWKLVIKEIGREGPWKGNVRRQEGGGKGDATKVNDNSSLIQMLQKQHYS